MIFGHDERPTALACPKMARFNYVPMKILKLRAVRSKQKTPRRHLIPDGEAILLVCQRISVVGRLNLNSSLR
jgi:hypothetical protein